MMEKAKCPECGKTVFHSPTVDKELGRIYFYDRKKMPEIDKRAILRLGIGAGSFYLKHECNQRTAAMAVPTFNK